MPFPGWDIHLPALGFDKCDIARMDLQTGPGIPKSIITKLHRLLNPRERGVSLTVSASETVENETKPAFLTHARCYLPNLTLHVPQKTRKPPPLGPREGRANCRMFCRLWFNSRRRSQWIASSLAGRDESAPLPSAPGAFRIRPDWGWRSWTRPGNDDFCQAFPPLSVVQWGMGSRDTSSSKCNSTVVIACGSRGYN